MAEKPYLRIGRAKDAGARREVLTYRALEILPGALTWATFGGMIAASRWLPEIAAGFIILFDLYWFLRTVYLSFHLRSSFGALRENLAVDWRAKLDALSASEYRLAVKSWRDVWHAVIMPVFTESYEIIRESVLAVVNSGYPAERLIVVLAAEEKGGKALEESIREVEKEFSGAVAHFLVTRHPAGLPGEIAGKGANEAWAGKMLVEKIIEPAHINPEHVVVSAFDIDTTVYPGYFDCLTYHFLTAEKPLRSSYQPVPLFINNIWYAPAFARIAGFSSTFWQMMQQARPERLITFSSHSMPLAALMEIGFWQTNVVSEDSRIFFQCFLHYDGDWRVVPLLFPVAMDANFAGTFWGTLKNQYRQQRRWGYGAENIPYLLYGFTKNKHIPKEKKRELAFSILEGFHSWATNAMLIFFLGWLPIAIGKQPAFSQSVLSLSLPLITKWIMGIAMIGLVTSSIVSIMLLPPRPPRFGRWKLAMMALQWLFLPLTIIFLSTVPAIDAQTRLMLGQYMGFWSTPKARRPETRKGVGKNR